MLCFNTVVHVPRESARTSLCSRVYLCRSESSPIHETIPETTIFVMYSSFNIKAFEVGIIAFFTIECQFDDQYDQTGNYLPLESLYCRPTDPWEGRYLHCFILPHPEHESIPHVCFSCSVLLSPAALCQRGHGVAPSRPPKTPRGSDARRSPTRPRTRRWPGFWATVSRPAGAERERPHAVAFPEDDRGKSPRPGGSTNGRSTGRSPWAGRRPAGRRQPLLQDPPPRTQNLAQWGWLSATGPEASASVPPSSNSGS